MGNSNSAANRAVSHALINRRSLVSIETCISDSKLAVLNALYHRLRLGPIETSVSDAYHVVLHAQNGR